MAQAAHSNTVPLTKCIGTIILFVIGADEEEVPYLQEVREQLDEQVRELLDEELEGSKHERVARSAPDNSDGEKLRANTQQSMLTRMR